MEKSPREALLARVLDGDGYASHAQRRAAFENSGVPDPARQLIDKVVAHAYTITDGDVAAAKAGGLNEDQIFELAVCAAIGESTRQLHSALDVLDAATEELSATEEQ